MRRTLKATPKMIERMAGFYAPLSRPAVLPIVATKPATEKQLDLAEMKPAEPKETASKE